MQITKELDLQNFEFWSGAKDHKFTNNELVELEPILNDMFQDGTSETTINDVFWFEQETLCEWLDIDFENDYLER